MEFVALHLLFGIIILIPLHFKELKKNPPVHGGCQVLFIKIFSTGAYLDSINDAVDAGPVQGLAGLH